MMLRFWESREVRDLRERVRQLEGELATSRSRETQLIDKIVLLAGLNPLQKPSVGERPEPVERGFEIDIPITRRTPRTLAQRRQDKLDQLAKEAAQRRKDAHAR
jgi:hypothetical protein